MNQRITTAAVVLLIAAAGAVPNWSPAMASLAATYTLELARADGNQQFALALGENGSAELTTQGPGTPSEPVPLGGVWGADGSTIIVVLESTPGGTEGSRLTFQVMGDSLVLLESEPDRFAANGMTFKRG